MMAHEDKAYQAMKLASTSISAPRSYVYGNRKQAYGFLGNAVYPLVGKSPDGSGSKGVLLIKNERDGRAFIDQHMVHRALRKGRPFIVRAFQRIFKPKPVLGLVVFQDFIPNLEGDWKILMWGDKACGLYRENRPKDFRASGSGKVHFVEIPSHILDFAMDVLEKLDLPWGSLDIGFTGGKCFLLEYQGIHFGLTASDRSSFYFRKVNGKWERVEEKIPIETEMANIILRDMSRLGWLTERKDF
jgi:glutathione synthase/RimK-type ligase-like ATP-grasp enzyme